MMNLRTVKLNEIQAVLAFLREHEGELRARAREEQRVMKEIRNPLEREVHEQCCWHQTMQADAVATAASDLFKAWCQE